MATPLELDPNTATPSPLLKAIVFPSPGFVPPIRVLLLAPMSRKIPNWPLVKPAVPVAFVPIRLPWIRLLFVPPSPMRIPPAE